MNSSTCPDILSHGKLPNPLEQGFWSQRLYELSMERHFLSPNEKEGGRGVKEKEGGSAGDSGFISSSGLKLGDDTSFKLGEIPSSSQEGFVVNSELLSSYARALIEDGCHKNIDSDVVKTMKNPSQTSRGVLFSTTPMVEKIKKIERLIIEGMVTLVDDEGKPLKKVVHSSDHDSEDEVASIDNDMENYLASNKDGYGNNNLLEHRRNLM
ncbi:hypothetical protein Tco_0228156 [Tanacetum coccineum]